MSQSRGAATKKSGVIVVDMYLTALFLAQDVSDMLRKMKIKPLGLISEFTGMIDEKFKNDTLLETELKKITIPKYPNSFKVALRYAEKSHVDKNYTTLRLFTPDQEKKRYDKTRKDQFFHYPLLIHQRI